MSVNSDFRDLLSALHDAEARYLLVGGYAVAFHGEPRFTKDLDIWVEPTVENAHRVRTALAQFGAPLSLFPVDELARPELVFQLGVAPHRIDILTQLSGLTFTEAWPHRVKALFGGVETWFIGMDDLIANKRATSRPQDLRDITVLETKLDGG
jgi:hypothetical protein